MNPDRRRKFNGAHPMHADSNLPRKMSKHARKLLRKRRREIADDEVPTCDDVSPQWLDNPGWASCVEVGERIENHNGVLLRRRDGTVRWLALDLNENAP